MLKQEPRQAKPVLVPLASRFTHHITGKSTGKTHGNVSYCYQSPWTKILEISSWRLLDYCLYYFFYRRTYHQSVLDTSHQLTRHNKHMFLRSFVPPWHPFSFQASMSCIVKEPSGGNKIVQIKIWRWSLSQTFQHMSSCVPGLWSVLRTWESEGSYMLRRILRYAPWGSSARSCNLHWCAVLLNRTHPASRVKQLGRESSEAGQCLRRKNNFQLPCSVVSGTNNIWILTSSVPR